MTLDRGFWSNITTVASADPGEIVDSLNIEQNFRYTPITNPVTKSDTGFYNVFDASGNPLRMEKQHKETKDIHIDLSKAIENLIKLVTPYYPDFTIEKTSVNGSKVQLISNAIFQYPVLDTLNADIVEAHLVFSFDYFRGNYKVNLLTNRLVCSNGMRINTKERQFDINTVSDSKIQLLFKYITNKLQTFQQLNGELAKIKLNEDEAWLYLTNAYKGKFEKGVPLAAPLQTNIDLVNTYNLYKEGHLNSLPSLGSDLVTHKETAYGLIQSTIEYQSYFTNNSKKETVQQASNKRLQTILGNTCANRLLTSMVTTSDQSYFVKPLLYI